LNVLHNYFNDPNKIIFSSAFQQKIFFRVRLKLCILRSLKHPTLIGFQRKNRCFTESIFAQVFQRDTIVLGRSMSRSKGRH